MKMYQINGPGGHNTIPIFLAFFCRYMVELVVEVLQDMTIFLFISLQQYGRAMLSVLSQTM